MLILSNNLWNCDFNTPAWAEKGEDCSADARVDGLVKAYTAVLPDVLGFQEMSRYMEKLIMERMKYLMLADGSAVRYEMVTGGFTPILFRYDKLRLLESGHAVYPAAFPPFEGCFNDVDSKGYTFAVLEERTTGKRVIVFSTHLWWQSGNPEKAHYQAGSDQARAYQILLASKKADELIARYDCPAILMGDFNAALGSACLNAVLAEGWLEAHGLCTGERDDANGYHYCFGDGWRHDPPLPYEKAIDHLLIKHPGNTEITRFRRFTEPFFDRLSDHYPVYAEMKLS